jgi:hypothetical protein
MAGLVERFDPNRHDVTGFGCGEPETDIWLRLEATADDRDPGAVVHVAVRQGRVVGCCRLGAFELQPPSQALTRKPK